MLRCTIISFLVILFYTGGYSQDLTYAREIIRKLTSPEFHGRGYVLRGDRKAADFIASEFRNMNLMTVADGYQQFFETPVNIFPGSMEVIINGKQLKPGIEFLVDPSSPSLKGTFDIISLSVKEIINGISDSLKDEIKGKFVSFDHKEVKILSGDDKTVMRNSLQKLQFGSYPLAGILLKNPGKLTWHASVKEASVPVIILGDTSLITHSEKVYVDIESRFIENYRTSNVIGMIRGRKQPDSMIVISAHYDHLGRMGKDTYFPGANDNASGVAMMLSLAKHFVENKPDNSMVFMAFGAEELGLLGSSYFIKDPPLNLAAIKFLVNLDINGTGDEGITVVNGKLFQEKFKKLQRLNNEKKLLPEVASRGEACNSDHCPFHMIGIPSFFIYTRGGVQAYHDIYDKAETLPLTEFNDLFTLLKLFIAGI